MNQDEPLRTIIKELLKVCKMALGALQDHPDLHFGTKQALEQAIAKAGSKSIE